jgi:hypothetical protein
MLTRPGARALILMLALVATATSIAGCQQKTLNRPIVLASPYEAQQLWAVAPFLNESGVAQVEGDRIADLMTEQAQQVQGIDTVPVNRVLLAMRKSGLVAITNEHEAFQIMNMLDVDGLIVGTVTAYDAYRPPKLGMATQLFVRTERNASHMIDPRTLTKSTSGEVSPGEVGPHAATSQAAGVFDASNHQTLIWLNNFASGRTQPDTAYGSDIYLVNMDLYTEFVCFRLLQDLLANEFARVPQPEADEG